MINRTVRTRMLDCAYIERGPANGKPLFLVHGFPDDARTWDVVAEALAGDGYRTIAPYVRVRSPRWHATCSILPMRSGSIPSITSVTIGGRARDTPSRRFRQSGS